MEEKLVSIFVIEFLDSAFLALLSDLGISYKKNVSQVTILGYGSKTYNLSQEDFNLLMISKDSGEMINKLSIGLYEYLGQPIFFNPGMELAQFGIARSRKK